LNALNVPDDAWLGLLGVRVSDEWVLAAAGKSFAEAERDSYLAALELPRDFVEIAPDKRQRIRIGGCNVAREVIFPSGITGVVYAVGVYAAARGGELRMFSTDSSSWPISLSVEDQFRLYMNWMQWLMMKSPR